jgi:putative flippase GtrA
MERKQFLYFILTGGVAAVVNFSSRIVLSHWMSYAEAIATAYAMGMLTAFVLNRLFVFREASNPLYHQAFWFTVVNLAAVLQTLLVSLGLARLLFPAIHFRWHPESVAHAFGVAFPVLTSYIGHKRLSFRNA